MDFLKKYWIWIAVVAAIIVALVWWNKSKSDQETIDAKPIDRLAELTSDQSMINKYIAIIKASPAWYNSVKEKATKNGVTEAEQLKRDAIWTITEDYKVGKIS